jgi:hypothetical protein
MRLLDGRLQQTPYWAGKLSDSLEGADLPRRHSAQWRGASVKNQSATIPRRSATQIQRLRFITIIPQ